jgi:hypothetical protein
MGELRRLVRRLLSKDGRPEDQTTMKRILVVEDDDNTREVVVQHLKGAGYATDLFGKCCFRSSRSSGMEKCVLYK